MERLCDRIARKIDERNFEPCLRYKCFSVKPDGDRVAVDWESQGDCSKRADFNRELKRAAAACSYAGKMSVLLRDRDGLDSFRYTLDAKPSDAVTDKSAMKKIRKILGDVDRYDDPEDVVFAVAGAVYRGELPGNLVEHFQEYGILDPSENV